MTLLRGIPAAAYLTGRHPDLIRRWYRTGRLTAACDTHTRAVLVDITQLAQLPAQRRPRLTPPPR